MSEYNTQKPRLILREYGRNIQKLVEYMSGVDDNEKRNAYAAVLVDLMRQINPNIKDSNEYNQKLWDDLFIMSDFKAEVDSPYPKPEKEILSRKPQKVDYNVNRIKYKHYGRNIELIVDKAVKTEDPEERESFIIYLGKLMKTFYASWNKEVVSDQVIIDHIKELSKNKLDIDPQKVKEENLFEVLFKEKTTKPKKENIGKRSGNGKKRRRN